MFDKILVGTDGSSTATLAVDRAVELATSCGASLTVLSAGRADRAQAIVDTEAERLSGSDVDVDTRVVDADAVSALIDVAGEGYDAVVVGNRGMTGLSRFFRLGSVPNKLSHHLPCTMLIVKTS